MWGDPNCPHAEVLYCWQDEVFVGVHVYCKFQPVGSDVHVMRVTEAGEWRWYIHEGYWYSDGDVEYDTCERYERVATLFARLMALRLLGRMVPATVFRQLRVELREERSQLTLPFAGG